MFGTPAIHSELNRATSVAEQEAYHDDKSGNKQVPNLLEDQHTSGDTSATINSYDTRKFKSNCTKPYTGSSILILLTPCLSCIPNLRHNSFCAVRFVGRTSKQPPSDRQTHVHAISPPWYLAMINKIRSWMKGLLLLHDSSFSPSNALTSQMTDSTSRESCTLHRGSHLVELKNPTSHDYKGNKFECHAACTPGSCKVVRGGI